MAAGYGLTAAGGQNLILHLNLPGLAFSAFLSLPPEF
jgi:hypothetical protein